MSVKLRRFLFENPATLVFHHPDHSGGRVVAFLGAFVATVASSESAFFPRWRNVLADERALSPEEMNRKIYCLLPRKKKKSRFISFMQNITLPPTFFTDRWPGRVGIAMLPERAFPVCVCFFPRVGYFTKSMFRRLLRGIKMSWKSHCGSSQNKNLKKKLAPITEYH